MSLALGFFAVVAATLVVSGFFKVRDAGPTEQMLRAVGLPLPRLGARLSGPAELAAGAAGLLVAGRAVALAVALLYVAFALMTLRLLRTAGAPSCGCFGRLSARPSGLHVGVNAAMAAGALAAAVLDVPAMGRTWSEPDGGGPLALAGLALATWLAVALLTVLPATLAAARRGPAEAAVGEFALLPPPAAGAAPGAAGT